MLRFEGSLARRLDFDSLPTDSPLHRTANLPAARGRQRFGLVQGPDKYALLENRRRAAQIKARHALALVNGDR
jgi:hypothetical protein